jgi:hypothetical protein
MFADIVLFTRSWVYCSNPVDKYSTGMPDGSFESKETIDKCEREKTRTRGWTLLGQYRVKGQNGQLSTWKWCRLNFNDAFTSFTGSLALSAHEAKLCGTTSCRYIIPRC